MRRTRMIGCFASIAFASSLPAAGPSAAGHWEGTLTVRGEEVKIVVDLEQGKDGAWKGEFDVPAQAVRNLALVAIAADGANVTFQMSGVPGDPTFGGTIEGDGMTGTLTQAGEMFPFKLQRKGDPKLGAPPDDGVKLVDRGRPGKGVEGEWHGVIDAGPAKLRLILHVTKGRDGALSGTLDSVDQHAEGIAIDRIVFERASLQFEIQAIKGSYKGTLSDDGSKITGTWTQGTGSLPLELLRAGKSGK